MMTILENNIQHTDTDKLQTLFPIKLKNKRILKLRKHRKFIRFVNYKYQINPENYCREKTPVIHTLAKQ